MMALSLVSMCRVQSYRCAEAADEERGVGGVQVPQRALHGAAAPRAAQPAAVLQQENIAVLNNELEYAGRAAFEIRCQPQATLSSDVSEQTTDSSMLMPP